MTTRYLTAKISAPQVPADRRARPRFKVSVDWRCAMVWSLSAIRDLGKTTKKITPTENVELQDI